MAKTSSFSGRKLKVYICPTWLHCILFRRRWLQSSRSFPDTVSKAVVPIRQFDTKASENRVQVEKAQSSPLKHYLRCWLTFTLLQLCFCPFQRTKVMMRMTTMTLCALSARMKLQMNPMKLSFVTIVDKVLFIVCDAVIPNTEQNSTCSSYMSASLF